MAASSYDEALRRVLAHEGGYADHPRDPGGPTKYGITLAVFRQNFKADATAADVKAMSLAQAKAIYRRRYWDALACDRLPAGLDYAVFDYGVNSGVGRAARVLRHLVGATPGARVDEATLALIARRAPQALIAALCEERLAFLKRLRTWNAFGKGWTRRVGDVRRAALALTAGGAPSAADERVASAAQGKGIPPAERAAQHGAAGAAAATGAIAAERAHSGGLPVGAVIAIASAALIAAVAVWTFWRWRARRLEECVAAAVIPEKHGAAS